MDRQTDKMIQRKTGRQISGHIERETARQTKTANGKSETNIRQKDREIDG